jgi:hypothetical protein
MAEDTVPMRFLPSAGTVCGGTKRIAVSNSDNRGLIVSEGVFVRRPNREMAVINLDSVKQQIVGCR